jgi:hypothetical protein
MKSVVELEINASQERVAELFANPENNTRWMDDLERYEPISGEPGMPGSTYRLVPKKGNMTFVATVITRNLPAELQLRLDASNVTVSVKGTLMPLSAEKTRLLSEEVFRFKGFFNKIFGFLAQSSIKKVHRHHMESFKRFAEAHQ